MNGFMDMTLEFMPSMNKPKPLESLLIRKYKVSPGYYIIPLKGEFPYYPIATFSEDKS